MIKRIQYGSIRFLFWALLLLAVCVSGLRLALSELNLFKIEIESQLSQQFGTQVSIAKLRGGLNDFKPELILHNITVQSQSNEKTTLQLQEVHLGLDLLSSLKSPLLESLHITLIGAKLSINRLESGVIAIQGLPNTENNQHPHWLMQGKQYKLIDSEINWHDEKRNADPIQLQHVNISLHNADQQHKVFINMELPETLGDSLDLAMNFTGDIFVPDSINARLFIQGKNIQLAETLTDNLPFNISVTKGRGDFSLWSTWKASQMTQMQGSIQVNVAEIQSKHNKPLPIDQLSLQFELQKQQHQWHLGIQQARLSSQYVDIYIPQLAVALGQDEDSHLTHIALNCPHLNLGPLTKMMIRHKLLPKNVHTQLHQLAIEGQVEDLLLIANPIEESFAISAQFKQINSQTTTDFPGVNGLSFYIKGTEQLGIFQLSSQQLTLTSPATFREPLYFIHLLGELHWQQQADNWVFHSPMLELSSTDLVTKNKFNFILPKADQPSSITLQSSFYSHDISKVPHYLTHNIVKQKSLSHWLDHAFLAGDIERGGLIFRGALKDTPFTRSEGVIELLFDAKNVDIHYADDWHLVENIDAEVRFFSDSLDINIYHGLANQATIEQASVSIESFTNSDTISIKGDISGDLNQAIGFLKHSPYQEKITTLSDLLHMQGLFSANIDLEVSMTDLPAKIKMTVSPKNAQAYVTGAQLPISEINGTLHISDKGIVSETLTANILGYPITAEISSNELNTRIIFSGQTDIPQLARQFPNQQWIYLTGLSHYQMHMNVPRDTTQKTKLQFTSNLQGIAIDFPPLSKSAGAVYPFSLDLSISSEGINAFGVNYQMSKDSLDINLKKILPHWQGLIHSPFANGSLFIPIDFSKDSEISLFCDQLNLSALEKLNFKTEGQSFLMQDFPGIKLQSEALYWNSHNLGRLELLTQAAPDGLLIKQLKITSASDELDLSGYWQQGNPHNLSTLKGSLLSLNFGHLLKQLKLSENIIDSTAEFQFSLNWPGAPQNISRETISGDIRAHLTNGRILNIEPGIGRILGALDTQKLFKRLRFDFSDITKKGLSFSEITADIAISQGLASTNNLHINAMPAKINVTGTTHLLTQEINLLATVLPKFPIAGTIIGSVANAITKTIIGDRHAGGLILSLLYEITGNLEHPEVNRQFSPALTMQPISLRKHNISATRPSITKY